MTEIIGKTFRHYKGGVYVVNLIAKHSETLEILVVYTSIKDNQSWARPISMFLDEVEIDGKSVKRFTEI